VAMKPNLCNEMCLSTMQ